MLPAIAGPYTLHLRLSRQLGVVNLGDVWTGNLLVSNALFFLLILKFSFAPSWHLETMFSIQSLTVQ